MTIELRFGRRRVRVKDHALQRFQERVRPALSVSGAAKDLRRLVGAVGVLTDEPPSWTGGQYHGEVRDWLVVGEDVAFPVLAGEDVVPTCLVRGGLTPRALERKAQRKRRKASGRARSAPRDPRARGVRARDARREDGRRWRDAA